VGLVAERPHAVAVAALRPRVAGAVLLLPRRHVESFGDLDAAELADLAELACLVTARVAEVLDPEGIGVAADLGEEAEQPEPHLSFEVVPRWADAPFRWVPYEDVPPSPDAERIELARRLGGPG
jgi:diadenosine tetraphosphate (Ap4A) HIT family hydrolase